MYGAKGASFALGKLALEANDVDVCKSDIRRRFDGYATQLLLCWLLIRSYSIRVRPSPESLGSGVGQDVERRLVARHVHSELVAGMKDCW